MSDDDSITSLAKGLSFGLQLTTLQADIAVGNTLTADRTGEPVEAGCLLPIDSLRVRQSTCFFYHHVFLPRTRGVSKCRRFPGQDSIPSFFAAKYHIIKAYTKTLYGCKRFYWKRLHSYLLILLCASPPKDVITRQILPQNHQKNNQIKNDHRRQYGALFDGYARYAFAPYPVRMRSSFSPCSRFGRSLNLLRRLRLRAVPPRAVWRLQQG